MTKILVTGATGTVGSQVVEALVKRGADVRAGVRDASKAIEGAEVVKLDFDDPVSVQNALKGVDRVFLLTPFVEDPKPYIRAIVESARGAGASFILRMSAAGADPSSSFALAKSHGEGEKIVAEGGTPWAVIRPTFFMDNIPNYLGASIQAESKTYGSGGEGKAAYVSTADIAEVAATILLDPNEHHGKTYELTGGQAHSDAEVARIVSDVVGREITNVQLTPEQQAQSMKGAPQWMIDALVGLEGVKRNGWASQISPAVKEILGREPETLQAFLTWRMKA